MEREKRVYPAEKPGGGWLSYLLLFLSAVVLLSGLVWREEDSQLLIRPAATATPIPLDESFDETMTEAEFTLPSAMWYALQLGAFENEESARQMAEQYARRGAAGFVWLDGRYRALAAAYPLREDAQTVRQQLSDVHMVETYLYEINLPSIRLRLSGMQGQLEILQAAFIHAYDLVGELHTLSTAMDRQEMRSEEVTERLNALNTQLQTVSLRLRQRFASPRHQTVAGLLQCFADFADFCTEAAAAGSDVAVGTLLKRQMLKTLYDLKQMYDTLSHT